jgi:hypothetical protein
VELHASISKPKPAVVSASPPNTSRTPVNNVAQLPQQPQQQQQNFGFMGLGGMENNTQRTVKYLMIVFYVDSFYFRTTHNLPLRVANSNLKVLAVIR